MKPDRRAWERFKRNRPAVVGALFLLGLVLLVSIGPFCWPYAPDGVSDAQFESPSWSHLFGTDDHGRDLLTRVLHGARVSLLVGGVGTGVSLFIGVCWGAAAGYLGGRWDSGLMRLVDILYALPSIVFVIVLLTLVDGVLDRFSTATGGANRPAWRLACLFAGLGAVSWLTMARIVRGQVLSLRTRPFVEASLSLGAGHARLLFRHILPNTTGVIIVYLALTAPAVILYESFLSYLGLGIQPPQASLGSLIAEGAAQINPVRTYWWIILFPATTLAAVLLALNFVADGLRDALDPRSIS